MSYSVTDQCRPMYGYNQSGNELGGLSSLARAFIMPRSWDIQKFPYQTPDGANLLFQLTSQANNPYWAWENDKITTQQKRTVANFNAGYKFTDWLSLDYTLGYNDYSQDRKNVINLGSRGYGGKGYIRKSVYNDAMLESTLLLTAEKDLMEDLNLRVTLGHNYNQETSSSFTANGPEIVNRGIYAIDNRRPARLIPAPASGVSSPISSSTTRTGRSSTCPAVTTCPRPSRSPTTVSSIPPSPHPWCSPRPWGSRTAS